MRKLLCMNLLLIVSLTISSTCYASKVVQLSWTDFKALFQSKTVTSQIQWIIDDNSFYDIWFYDSDGAVRYQASIDSVAVSADRTDFENNFKNSANKEPSLIIRSILNPRPGKYFSKAAVDSGASSDLNADGSTTPIAFNVVASTGKKFFIHEIVIIMEDQNINYQKFGGIAGGLTNGLDVEVKEGGEAARDVTAFGAVKNNAQFGLAGSGLQLTASSTDLLVVDFNIAGRGTTFELVDSNSDFFRVTVNDDLTAIDNFKVVAQGYEVSE